MTRFAAALVALSFAATGGELPSILRQPAFQHFYNLEFDEAQADFMARVAADPSSAEAHNLVAQAIIFRTMYRVGALDSSLVSDKNPFFNRPKATMSPEDTKLFLDSIEHAMSLAKARVEENPKDSPALYALGVAYGLRANYDFIVKKAWMASLKDFTQARKFHYRVTEVDPQNVDGRLTQGLHTYIAGNLTFPWKQLGFLAGFRGDKAEGIRILEDVAAHGQNNKADAMMFLAAIYRRDHRSAEAIPLTKELIRWFPRNFLLRMELVRLYADIGEKDKALAVVTQIEEMKRAGAPLAEEKIQELRASVEQPR